jgi:hypothetical protein
MLTEKLTTHEIEEVRELIAEKRKRDAQRIFEAMDQYPKDKYGYPYDPRVNKIPTTTNTVLFTDEE